MSPPARLDHLVVAARTLAEGVAWCEGALGAVPGPGGQHALMGTHNRLLRLAGPAFSQAYLEIIAIEPGAARPPGAPKRRWFDLDNPLLQQSLATHGPQLAHFVVRVPDLSQALAAWRARGMDVGQAVEASRMTPQGLLRWQISLREDGQRQLGGALPALIEWGAAHPSDAMAPSGLALGSLQVMHPQPQALRDAFADIGLADVSALEGEPGLRATLLTPRGPVTLRSPACRSAP